MSLNKNFTILENSEATDRGEILANRTLGENKTIEQLKHISWSDGYVISQDETRINVL